MNIINIQADYLTDVPTKPQPFRKEPPKARIMIVSVETDQGIVGYGMGGVTASRITADFINKDIAPVLKGEDALLIERIWYLMGKTFNRRIYGSLWTSAMTAIDIALWDIKGKFLDRTVSQLLGGAREKAPIYMTFGLPPIYPVDELVEEAKYYVKEGYEGLKMNVGRFTHVQGPDEDASRVQAIREAVGPNVQIMLDAFNMMSLPEATRLAHLSEPYNVTFFEEPVYANDAHLMADLRKKTTIPLASGAAPNWGWPELLIQNAVDIVQPNVANDGGFTAALKIAAMAEAFNVPIAHGNGSGPINIHLQTGVANGGVVEMHYLHWMMYEAVFESVPQPVKGYVSAPTDPGTGFVPKPGIIKEYSSAT